MRSTQSVSNSGEGYFYGSTYKILYRKLDFHKNPIYQVFSFSVFSSLLAHAHCVCSAVVTTNGIALVCICKLYELKDPDRHSQGRSQDFRKGGSKYNAKRTKFGAEATPIN